MSDQSWAWVLFFCELVGLGGIAIAGQLHKWWGWLITIFGVSVPWIAYSIITQKWGFLALSLLWLTTYSLNAYSWKYDRTKE